MDNVITNTKEVLVANQALAPWMKTLLPIKAFSTNFSPEAKQKGDTVRVPLVGEQSASLDFDGSYKGSGSTVTGVSVSLDRHKFQTVKLTAKELSETNTEIFQTLVSAATARLAQDVLQDILSVVTAANYGEAALDINDGSFGWKSVLDVRQACNTEKMPSDNRALILDSTLFTTLLADDVVAKSYVTTLAQDGIVNAKVARLANFEMHEVGCIPENGEKLVGFAAHPEGLAVAMRYLEPAAQYEQAGAVTDPATGLTFGYLRYSDTDSNAIIITVECLYGFKVIRENGIKRIVNTAVVTPAKMSAFEAPADTRTPAQKAADTRAANKAKEEADASGNDGGNPLDNN